MTKVTIGNAGDNLKLALAPGLRYIIEVASRGIVSLAACESTASRPARCQDASLCDAVEGTHELPKGPQQSVRNSAAPDSGPAVMEPVRLHAATHLVPLRPRAATAPTVLPHAARPSGPLAALGVSSCDTAVVGASQSPSAGAEVAVCAGLADCVAGLQHYIAKLNLKEIPLPPSTSPPGTEVQSTLLCEPSRELHGQAGDDVPQHGCVATVHRRNYAMTHVNDASSDANAIRSQGMLRCAAALAHTCFVRLMCVS